MPTKTPRYTFAQRAVEGRYHDLVRDKAVADGLMTKIETRTAYVVPAKLSSTPQR